MRPILTCLAILLPMLIPPGAARAEFSLFGSPNRTPANPFASNYASRPVREPGARVRPRPKRAGPERLRPPRDVPR